jgi:hypothetical protein
LNKAREGYKNPSTDFHSSPYTIPPQLASRNIKENEEKGKEMNEKGKEAKTTKKKK